MAAVALALMRARESQRPDRLFEDPYAAPIGHAAREAFLTLDWLVGPRETWSHVERLADALSARHVPGVRASDDVVTEAVSSGSRQVVTLGAGLETRAFRLALSPDATVFEIDTPEMAAFMEAVLDVQGATALLRALTGLGPDAGALLAGWGWQIEFHASNDLRDLIRGFQAQTSFPKRTDPRHPSSAGEERRVTVEQPAVTASRE